jgi:hypothetical protein
VSTENGTKTGPGEVLKTPSDWCLVEGIEILDPDGWRGVGGRPWTDPITLAEFNNRLIVCTMRRVAPGETPRMPISTTSAGEHHVGSLDLSGEGNAPKVEIPLEAVVGLATALVRSASWDTYTEETQQVLIATSMPMARASLEAAYPAIRQQIAEEIAAAIDAGEDRANEASKREGIAGNRGTSRAWDEIATGYMRAAEIAREIGEQA